MIKEELVYDLMVRCADYTKNKLKTESGCGPFGAFIVDDNGQIIHEEVNRVQDLNLCVAHAETLAIINLQKKLKTYDLSKYNYTLIATGEPCMMCAGTILWSGIKEVYYGATTQDIEGILGFDEGVKCDWVEQFKQRGINIVGEIARDKCIDVLKFYKEQELVIYKPCRK